MYELSHVLFAIVIFLIVSYVLARVDLLNTDIFVKYLIVIGFEFLTLLSAVLLYKLFTLFYMSNKITLDIVFRIIFIVMTSVVMYKWVQEYRYWLISVLFFIYPISIIYFWCFGEKNLQYFISPFIVLFLFITIFLIVWLIVKFIKWVKFSN